MSSNFIIIALKVLNASLFLYTITSFERICLSLRSMIIIFMIETLNRFKAYYLHAINSIDL